VTGLDAVLLVVAGSTNGDGAAGSTVAWPVAGAGASTTETVGADSLRFTGWRWRRDHV
jgi:hypothetical protein